MTVCAYSASFRELASAVDFCAVYFSTLLGRCAFLSLPVLGVVLALRTVLQRNVFARTAIWSLFLLIPLLGKLRIYYQQGGAPPAIWWQSLCAGHGWARYGYLVGVLAVWFCTCHQRRLVRRLLRGLPVEQVEGVRVYLCDAPVTPFAFGLLPPRIVLPRMALRQLSPAALSAVLRHEQTHIRLGQLWALRFWDLLSALLWGNFLLIPAGAALREDLEALCDQVTMRDGGLDPVSYGGALLECLTLLREEQAVVSHPAAFVGQRSYAALKWRFRRVLEYVPYSRRTARAFLACVVLLLLLGTVAIHWNSMPRYMELTGATVFLVRDDVKFITVFDGEAEKLPLRSTNVGVAELDCQRLQELLPKDAPADGMYCILWGGFLKLPGMGGALNTLWVEDLSGGTVELEFQDVRQRLVVRLIQWM